MGGGSSELKGPDLAAGIRITDLREGEPLLGHAHGEPVLLVRSSRGLFAIGSKCTHYGGPLHEGLVVGETVRCPWHHACFRLRTGEPARPPALNDVAAWNVEQRGEIVVVTGRNESARRSRTPAHSPTSIIVIGAGAAGDVAAETLRHEGYAGPLTMIDMEPDSPYDRPNLSKDYLAGTAPEEWIPLHPPDYYRERQIEILRATVKAIDVKSRSVVLEDGGIREFDALLLAPGAEPVRLPLLTEGARILYLRSLADSRAIIAAAESARRAVVIGASFIGLEVAASLRHRGLEVDVVAPEDVPLARIMGPDLGRFVRQVHEEHGVTFHLGRTARAANRAGVTLDDGTELAADFVVAGVGVRPRVTLAQDAGLHVDDGIVVNPFLETSSPGIFAAGDAASWPDPRTGSLVRVEHWVLAERTGQFAAWNMLGAREQFDAVPFFWSQHYDAVIAYVGNAREWDEAALDGNPDDRDCAVTFRKSGKRLAVATIFRDRVSLEAELQMEREVRAVTR